MKGLKYILSVIRYRLGKNLKRIEGRRIRFPGKVNDLELVKVLKSKSVTGFFSFAVYKNNKNEKIFCKAWFGKTKDIGYIWLRNEITVYTYLSKISKSTAIRIPKYYGAYKDNHLLLLFIEHIEGKNVRYLSNNERMNVYEKAVKYFKESSKNLESNDIDIIELKPFYLVFSLLSLLILSIYKYPHLRSYLLKGIVLFFINIFNVFRYSRPALVHRDIINNMYKKDRNYYITDFQVSVIADPLFELSNLALGLYQKKEIYALYKGNSIYITIRKNKQKYSLYKLFCLHAALYDLNSLHNVKEKYNNAFIKEIILNNI